MASIDKPEGSGIKMKPTGKQRTSLLGMPPEIRNNIYEHALIDSEPIPIRYTNALSTLWTGPSDPRATVKEPALLATCKQIRDEGLAIFYSENTFEPEGDVFLDDHHVIHTFLKTLSDQKLSLLRSIHAICCNRRALSKPQEWFSAMHVFGEALINAGRGVLRRDAILVQLVTMDDMVWSTVDGLNDFRLVKNGWKRIGRSWNEQFLLKRKEGASTT